MRQELRAGNRSIFSRILQEELTRILQSHQQAILFLNRRGSATFVMCRDCGTIMVCPNCEMPLTYHTGQEKLICHYCGHHEINPTLCPACQSKRIKYFGIGTQRLDELVHEAFPHARVLRWDQDTAKKKGAHEEILHQFATRQADILVGTQMIAKGLDIPLVTLVGIISGDTALGLPDFRTGERTFQLLTQVAGRAGRSLLGGKVILQTYQPDHYAIQAAADHDYARFYVQEIEHRRKLRYPPYIRLARIVFQHPQPSEVEREARHVAERLQVHQNQHHFGATEIIGPTPCFFSRMNNIFYWHIIIRSPDPVTFLNGLDIGNGLLDIDPVSLL
jgi:primosomal protein N' (replication factor Y)